MCVKMFLLLNPRFLQGIGRRVMERYGWRDGRGVGAEGREGRVEPVAALFSTDDGRIVVGDAELQVQLPGESAGLGFHGPLVPRRTQNSTQMQRQRPREPFVRRANSSGQTANCIASSAPSGGRRLLALTGAPASASASNARQLVGFVPSGSVPVARAPSQTACASDSSSKALVSRPAPGVLAIRRPPGVRLAREKALLEESLLRRSDADAQLKLRGVANAATPAPGGYWTLNRNTHRN